MRLSVHSLILAGLLLAGCAQAAAPVAATPSPAMTHPSPLPRQTAVSRSPTPPAGSTPPPSSTPPPTRTPGLSPTPTATPTPGGPQTVPATDPRITYVGRFDFSDPAAPTFDWPGVLIEASFTGPALTLLLEDGNNLYNLTLDGDTSVLWTYRDQASYPVATDLGPGLHTIRLVKRTEFNGAVGTFRGFSFPEGGGLAPPPPRPARRIEVIGDSITAGYGVEGDSPTCPYSAQTQNIEATYAAILGRSLKAEVMFTAVSGIGVIRNYNDPDLISGAPMTARYERAIADDPATRWNFRAWKPDVIIINLGTNDFSTTPQPTQAIFVQAYIDLLNTIRRHYPLTPIIAMSPPIIQEPAATYIQTAVNHMNTAQRDTNVHYFAFTPTLVVPQDYGCDYHPNVAGQQKIADQLQPVVQEVMGWD